jgi:hypothetical protein
MPYDPNLDKALFSESVESETAKVTVAVMSYNEGMPKLQISRQNRNQDGEWKWAKLGRMVKEEVEAVIPIMQKAIEHL